MAEWLPALAASLARDGRAVLVTVAHANGSTPRESGAAMVVTAQGMAGSIGGGHLEFEALRIARGALAGDTPRGAWLVRFPLAARLGQCCGGVATLAFQPVAAQAAGWLEAAVACQRAAVPMALVSRIGGAPEGRTQLLVTADHASGSLGSTALDSFAVTLARPQVQSRRAGAGLVAADDGSTLLMHTIVPSDFAVLVFGNGHVGRALVQVLGALPARVRWVDGRDHDFPAQVPGNVEVVVTDAPEEETATARPGTYAVIATHSHALDYTIVAAALAREDWRYLGLIGSQAKRNQFARRLAARGIGGEAFARITCPIGVSGGLAIRSKEPGAIAVAVAAEMLALRERHAAQASPARDVVALHRGRRTP
ncbi:MAG: xanthine dehydrogenase accessory protein XdhC [Burkholderiales bacterium]